MCSFIRCYTCVLDARSCYKSCIFTLSAGIRCRRICVRQLQPVYGHSRVLRIAGRRSQSSDAKEKKKRGGKGQGKLMLLVRVGCESNWLVIHHLHHPSPPHPTPLQVSRQEVARQFHPPHLHLYPSLATRHSFFLNILLSRPPISFAAGVPPSPSSSHQL